MRDLLWRTYQPADAPALAELMNAIEQHAGASAGNTAEQLHGLITALVGDPASDSSMVFTPDGALVAAGFTTTPPPGGSRVYLTGGVHPQWRGRGLGREILRRHLARAAEIHRVSAPEAAWTAEVPRTPTGDEDAVRLFRRFGLTPVRYWLEMTAPTAHATTAAVPDGIRVQPYSPQYQEAVHAAHMDAFSANWTFQYRDLTSWAPLTVGSKDFVPDLSLVALDGAELVGYLLSYRHADPERVAVGHLGVRRPWRGRGLASALLAIMLEAAGRVGHKEVVLSVDTASAAEAVGIYQRAGFTVESSTVTHSIPLGD